jgi:hypothetical protein
MGYGYTPEEAVARLMDDFAVAYDGLIDAEDDHLTRDAVDARDTLRALVGRVSTVEYDLDVDYGGRSQQVGSRASLFVVR